MHIQPNIFVLSPCDWCGSSQYEVLFQAPDRLEKLPGVFRLVKCRECGLIRQNPHLRWSSLKEYYPENYASYNSLIKDHQNWLHRLDKRYGPWKRKRAIEHYQKGGRLLEIGCGTGTFLEEMLYSGNWQMVGVEPNAKVAANAQNNLGVPIFAGRFSEVPLQSESFDVIAMWNVLEHLEHPVQDLRRVYTLLKPGGWLVLSIPNLESLEAKVFGPYWSGWDLPRHLYIFPRKTLRQILVSLGLRVVAERCLSTSYDMLGVTLEFWSQSWEKQQPDLKRLLLKVYRSLIIRAALVIPLAVMDRITLTDSLSIFAQKKT